MRAKDSAGILPAIQNFPAGKYFLSCARASAAAIQNKKQENQPPSYYIFMKSLCALRQISHKTGKNLHCFYMYPKNSASKPFLYHQNSMPPQISRFCFVIFLYKSRQTNTHFIICCKTPYLLMQPIAFRRTVLHKILSASCFKNASAALLNTG